MKPSPLRLEHYFFTRIHVEAARTIEKPGQGDVSSRVDCAAHKEDPRRWMVSLVVRQHDDSRKRSPQYAVDVEVFGLFTVDKAVPDEKVEAFVRANGPAVLYGSVREMVALITARGPHPAVQLPSVTFVDEVQPNPAPAAKPRQATKKRAVTK